MVVGNEGGGKDGKADGKVSNQGEEAIENLGQVGEEAGEDGQDAGEKASEEEEVAASYLWMHACTRMYSQTLWPAPTLAHLGLMSHMSARMHACTPAPSLPAPFPPPPTASPVSPLSQTCTYACMQCT